jgi:hypothetical protein
VTNKAAGMGRGRSELLMRKAVRFVWESHVVRNSEKMYWQGGGWGLLVDALIMSHMEVKP